MMSARLETFIGSVLAVAGLAIVLGSVASTLNAQITCTGTPVPDHWCNPAHPAIATTPPGPGCTEAGGCQPAAGSVCTGQAWQDAVAGICNANTGNETGDCVEDYAKTLVTVKKYFKV